jgi:hypothetical protein
MVCFPLKAVLPRPESYLAFRVAVTTQQVLHIAVRQEIVGLSAELELMIKLAILKCKWKLAQQRYSTHTRLHPACWMNSAALSMSYL